MANPEPTSATGRMEAARRHRSRAYAERNELIAVLARLYPSHLMPAGGALGTLNTRWVVCIHTPALLCWVITQEEADDYFASMKRVDENHWDKSNRAERSERLSTLTALPPPQAPGTKPKKATKGAKANTVTPTPEPPRRPGDFSRKRTKGLH